MTTNKESFEESVNSIEETTKSKINSFLVKPIKMGFLYFAILFSIILFVKMVNYLSAENAFFVLNIYDVLISIVGFSLGFILEFALQLRKRIGK